MTVCGYPIEVPLSIGQKAYHKTIVAVGRFSDPRKNIGMLMRTFGNLHDMLPGVTMIIVGQIPAMEILAPFARHEWFDKVTFTGPIDAQALRAIYDKVSVMLVTSYQEGFGIAGLEAMAHGVPIVSTDCGGVLDYVVDGQTGFLVDIDDDKEMALKTCSLLINHKLYSEFSQAGKALVQQQFSQERIYSLFQHGFTAVYPELSEMFEKSHERTNHQPHLHSLHQ